MQDICSACQRPGLGHVNLPRFGNCHMDLQVKDPVGPDVALQNNQYGLAVHYLGMVQFPDGSFSSVYARTRVWQSLHWILTDEQQMIMNGQPWGFLSVAVSGSASTLFKRAGVLQGIDAWRILTRHILQGKDIRIETLRDECRNRSPNRRPRQDGGGDRNSNTRSRSTRTPVARSTTSP